MRRVTDEVNILFKSLQFGSLLVTQQVEAFSKFIGVLCEKFSVQGPLSPLQLTDWDAGAAVRDGAFVIRSTDVTTFMQGLGSTECALFDGLEESKRDQICSAFVLEE